MPIMESSYYFPFEEINYINFPEVRQNKTNIENIIAYSQKVRLALADYNEGKFDRIDLNAGEIQNYADLCRSVSRELGMAQNVCFDVLLDIREIHKTLLNLLYLKRQHGDQVVGAPTVEEDGGEV